jgi:hypothetical protein
MPAKYRVMRARADGDGGSLIAAAVVDHEDLDAVEAGDLARHIGQRPAQRLLLVEARDLDDQLASAPLAGERAAVEPRRGVLRAHAGTSRRTR